MFFEDKEKNLFVLNTIGALIKRDAARANEEASPGTSVMLSQETKEQYAALAHMTADELQRMIDQLQQELDVLEEN